MPIPQEEGLAQNLIRYVHKSLLLESDLDRFSSDELKILAQDELFDLACTNFWFYRSIKDFCQVLAQNRVLSIEQVSQINLSAAHVLQNAMARQLLTAHHVTQIQIVTLNVSASRALLNPDIRSFIEQGILTMTQVLALRNINIREGGRLYFDDLDYLQTPFVLSLLKSKEWTGEQIFSLKSYQRRILQNTAMHPLIMSRVLNFENISQSTAIASFVLCNDKVLSLLKTKTLTIEQILNLNEDVGHALVSPVSELWLTDKIFTTEQFLNLNSFALQALNSSVVQRNLKHKIVSVEQVIELNAERVEGFIQAQERRHINKQNSTHVASVHKTASESALRLKARYGLRIEPIGLKEIMRQLKHLIDSPSVDRHKNLAAGRCIARITAAPVFKDPKSNITLIELLALTFLAVKDRSLCILSLEDASKLFIDGLYEIQRGGNISEDGIDNKAPDHSICPGGAFNKLISSLSAIHPDATLVFITTELAACKLPKVVLEKAMDYLQTLINPETAADFCASTALIRQLQENGIAIIWDKIKSCITTCMFDEFGSLYRSQEDPSFITFIEAGQCVDLDDLSGLQQAMERSEGYRAFCAEQRRKSGFPPSLFFSSPEGSSAPLGAAVGLQDQQDQCIGCDGP